MEYMKGYITTEVRHVYFRFSGNIADVFVVNNLITDSIISLSIPHCLAWPRLGISGTRVWALLHEYWLISALYSCKSRKRMCEAPISWVQPPTGCPIHAHNAHEGWRPKVDWWGRNGASQPISLISVLHFSKNLSFSDSSGDSFRYQ